jgi:phenylalanyl-tRNA synthetase beta chain
MLVSYEWLKDYVPLAMSPQELTDRLMMVGLNHESTEKAGDDFTIDLEVTSNRPDCLGHIGVAREISVVFDLPLTIKDPQPKQGKTPTSELISVAIECRDLCPRYVARVIRGVKIGPSPKWMQDRLATIGIAAINNVVDTSNYVMMEIGQPLHTFDYARIGGKQIIVRRAKAGEQFMAIDHKTYELDPNVCVIADANHPVALGGVMGGADSEVSDSTKDVLVEAAEFDPLSIRATARKLILHSPSSYRFERMVDSEMVDWASRRCCELILDLAGGELASGVVDVGVKREAFKPITLRLSQIERVLGIQVPPDTVERILTALGNEKLARDSATIKVQPPSWRRDLEREIDLVEEVARIHGYDKIPEDVGVRMAASYRRNEERRDATVRGVLTAAGYDEALTASVVSDEWVQAFSPWNDETAIATNSPLLRGADRLRKSLVPSLLNARRENEALSNPHIELFETAKVYLPRKGQLPIEWWMLGMTSAGGFEEVKGVVETLATALNPKLTLSAEPAQQKFLDAGASCKLLLDGETVGYLGAVSKAGLKQFGLRSPTTIAELRLDLLGRHGDFVRRAAELSPFPAIEQDLNFIVDEVVRWSDLEAAVKSAGGALLEGVRYRETYHNEKIDGPNKKRLLLSIQLRSREATLTSEQADGVRAAIIDACGKKLGAKLVG